MKPGLKQRGKVHPRHSKLVVLPVSVTKKTGPNKLPLAWEEQRKEHLEAESVRNLEKNYDKDLHVSLSEHNWFVLW